MTRGRRRSDGAPSMATARRSWQAAGHLGIGAALTVFVAALVLRLLHLWQISATPFATVLMGDARAYDAWAQTIASGDVIGNEVFYQAPLYPYFLGGIYVLLGRDLMLVRVCQAVVGAFSCVLLGAAAARLFSRMAGVVAGLILAVYAPAIFFDGLIQKSVLDVFLVSLVLWLLSGLAGLPDGWIAWRRWLVIGLAMGSLGLTRENALVLVAVALGWIVARLGLPARSRLVTAAFFMAGVTLAVGPVAARNAALGHGLYLTTSQLGPNLFIGNNPDADGTYMSLRPGRGAPEYERQDASELAESASGRSLSPAEVSRYWTREALDFITEQPRAWLRLMGRKFMLLWNAQEVLDTESQEAYAAHSMVLRLGSVFGHFGVLVPLAVFGIWSTRSASDRLRLFHLIILAYAGSVIAFYVFARYRFPLVPMLALFAAAGSVQFVGGRRPIGRSLSANTRAGIVLAAGAAVLANWPLLDSRQMVAITHTNMGTALRAQGRLDEAIASHRLALSVSPGNPVVHYNLANALLVQGRTDEAARHFQVALQSLPGSADTYVAVGISMVDSGRLEDAIQYFRRALALNSASIAAHENLAFALAAQRQLDAAVLHLRRTIELDPGNTTARYNLGSVLLEKEDFAGAAAEFELALQVSPYSAEVYNGLGIALAAQGRNAEAVSAFKRALTLDPKFSDAQRNLDLRR